MPTIKSILIFLLVGGLLKSRVTLIAQIEGPYVPAVGIQQVPLPAQNRWISR